MTRILAAWLLVGAVAGCQFDAAVPPGALVRCDDGRCPPNFVCRQRLGVCAPVDTTGTSEPPKLTSASVTPARSSAGAVVTAAFTVSEALAVPPVVTLLQPGGAQALVLESQDGTAYAFSHRADVATTREGPARVVVDLVDRSGEEAVGLPVGVVEFDFTAPRIVDAVFVAPRAGDDAGVLRTRAEELVGVRLTASEALATPPPLLASTGCDAGVAFVVRAAQGPLVDYLSDRPPTEGCEYALAVGASTDVAGNPLAATTLPLRFSVDATPPTVTNVELLAPRDGGFVPATTFSRQPGFDEYWVRFRLSDPAAQVTARLDQTALPPCACTGATCLCQGRVTAADTEGSHVLSVSAVDSSGNVGSASLQVQLDFTPPALVPALRRVAVALPVGCPLTQVTALAPGGEAAIEFSLDESGSASLRAAPPAVTFVEHAGSATHFAFGAVPAAGAGQATVLVTVDAVDLVGNAAQLPLGLPLLVSADTPAAPDVNDPNAIVYARAPWGSRDGGVSFAVRGQPGAVATPTVQVLADGAPLALAPTDGGAFVAALQTVDRPVVSVRAVDSACNMSAAVQVRNVEWHATLNGKVVGRGFENPHLLQGRAVQTPAVDQQAQTTELAPQPGLTVTGTSTWLRRREPLARNSHRLVWDAARKRLVMFGGVSAGFNDDVFEWDSVGGVWLDRSPVPRPTAWPAARSLPGLAYDGARQRVVLFGGLVGASRTSELWEWDGATGLWVDRTPSPRPPSWPSGREQFGMAYDAVRQRVLLFGGTTNNTWDDELWEWDGAAGTFTNRTPTPRPSAWPPARMGHGMVYDSARQRMVLFGGTTSSPGDEVWELDPAAGTWTKRGATATPRPTNRGNFGLAYDSLRQRVVLFGPADELWEWDGAAGSWANLTPAVRPTPGWPVGRTWPGLAFDGERGMTMLFSGYAGTTTQDEVWGWNGTQWTVLSPQPRPPPAPTGRHHATGSYDPIRRRTLVFGGTTSQNFALSNNDLWEWDSQAGSWRALDGGVRPSPRLSLGMVYDRDRQRQVIFGGQAGTSLTDEVWEFDSTTSVWTNRTPTVRPTPWPAPRGAHAMAYDSDRQRVVVFGGGALAQQRELWEWDGDGGVWANRTPAPLPAQWPSARQQATLVYDQLRHRAVLFGGITVPSSVVADELWEWDGASGTWTNRTPTPRPAAWPAGRAEHGMVWNSQRQTVMVFSGSTSSVVDDLWEWNGASGAWVEHTPAVRPPLWAPGVTAPALAFDELQGRLVFFGGTTATTGANINADVWEWAPGDTTTRPGIDVHFGLAFAGVEPSATLSSITATVVAGGSSGAQGSPGWKLWVSSSGGFVDEASDPGGLTSPTTVQWTTSSPTRMSALLWGPERRISLAVTPAQNNGAQQPARVRLDWVDLTVRYRRP